MSQNSKKSISSTLALILLGMAGFFTGPKSLIILIPAAILIWLSARPMLRGHRN